MSREDEEIYKQNYEDVLNELIIFNGYKYTELVRLVYNNLNLNKKFDLSSYTIRKYNFNNQLDITPRIFKFNCCTYELTLLVNTKPMYSLIDIFDDDDDNVLKCLATFDESELKIEGKKPIEKVKLIIDFLDNFINNYIYSRYLDEFVLKSEINKKIKIENQLDQLCKIQVDECIICYNKVEESLTTCCCGKHICRICIDKIIPLKCPNCRHANF